MGVVVSFLFGVWLLQTPHGAPVSPILLDPTTVSNDDENSAAPEIHTAEGETIDEGLTLSDQLSLVSFNARAMAESESSGESNESNVTIGSTNGVTGSKAGAGESDNDSQRNSRAGRWDIQFQAPDLATYAAQLDCLGIQLGCVGRKDALDLVQNVSTKPVRLELDSQTASKQKNLFFLWRKQGPLANFDLQIMEQAGIVTQDRIIVKFVSSELEERLSKAELAYAQANNRPISEIHKTVFTTQAAGQGCGWELIVAQQW